MRYPLDHPFSLSVEEVLRLSQTYSNKGITEHEAAKRGKVYGLNTYKNENPKSLWLIFLGQFKRPVVHLLVVGAAVSLYFKDFLETIAILVVIIVNAHD